MARRETSLIVAGTAQANTGQTTLARVPRWARAVMLQLSIGAAAGTTPLTDYKLDSVMRKRTLAAVVAVGTAGDGTHNEVQTVTLTGGPTGGCWGLTWGGVSANVAASTGRVFACDATAAEVQNKLNEAIKAVSATYGAGTPVAVARAGAGTSGSPYVYTITFSGPGVAITNVDSVAVLDGELFTEAATAIDFRGWDGITQIAGTTSGDVFVNVGPSTPEATDDTGPEYNIRSELPEVMGHKLTFDRTSGNETYTYSLYATYIG